MILVYTVLIFINVLLSWIGQFRPIPYNLTLRAVTGFVEESTNPFLNLFRAWVPADRAARHQPDRRRDRARASSAAWSSA